MVPTKPMGVFASFAVGKKSMSCFRWPRPGVRLKLGPAILIALHWLSRRFAVFVFVAAGFHPPYGSQWR